MAEPEAIPEPKVDADLEQRRANRRAYLLGYRQAIRESELALQEGSRMKSIRFVLANQRQHLNRVIVKWAEGADESATTPPTLDVAIIHKSLELVEHARRGRAARRAQKKGKDLPRVLRRPQKSDTILGAFVDEDE